MKVSTRMLIIILAVCKLSAGLAICPSPLIFKSDFEDLMVPEPNSPIVSANDAVRFLTQATFGAQLKEVRRIQAIGYTAWLDEQINMEATLQDPCMQATLADPNQPLFQNSRMEAWFLNSAEGEDQLRQRMAFALSQLFVVSDQASLSNEIIGLAKYYDYLAINAFGNFRDVLEGITLNSMMGIYLGMFRNAKADPILGTQPDENYAREVLQLFTIGLHQLEMNGNVTLDIDGNPIPTYDQTVIENFARVFTGWNYAGCEDNNWRYCHPADTNVFPYEPMEANEAYHDTDSKTLLNGFPLAAGQTAQQDLTAALDNIFNHPNVPPFISKQLIQRFVTSNPSPGYILRVANVFADNGSGVRGDLGAVIRAVLLDDEARNNAFIGQASFGKLKEPLIRQIALWRAFEARSPNGRYSIWNPEFELLQRPLGSPSVFNFYTPNFQLPGPIRDQGLTSPEFQITSETSIVTMANVMSETTTRGHHLFDHYNDGLPLLQLHREAQIYADQNAFLDHLDLLLFAGQMSANTRQVAIDLMAVLEDPEPVERIASVLYILVLSPEYVVQR